MKPKIKKIPKTITVGIKKGGVGKSAVARILADFLALSGKVCLIDGDESSNTTKRTNVDRLNNQQAELENIFKNRKVEPVNIQENLDLVLGTASLEEVNVELASKFNNTIKFLAYLNKENTFDDYDYIVIDTRNDTNIITNNMIVASDLVLGVCDTCADSYDEWLNLMDHVEMLRETVVNGLTDEPYVHAKVKYIGNKVSPKTNVSKQFKEVMEEDEDCLGYIEDRSVFDEAILLRKSVLDYIVNKPNQNESYKKFVANTLELLENIKNIVDES